MWAAAAAARESEQGGGAAAGSLVRVWCGLLAVDVVADVARWRLGGVWRRLALLKVAGKAGARPRGRRGFGAAVPWVGCCAGDSHGDLVGGVALGPAWKAERRLFLVLFSAAWVAEPAASQERDLGVSVLRLVFRWRFVSLIRVKALSPAAWLEPTTSAPLGVVPFLEALLR